MNLDPYSLLVVNAANLLVLGSTLPFIMGKDLSPAARNARRSLIMQALGWMALIAAGLWEGQWIDWLLSSISMACISASQWLLFLAFSNWLGPRPLRRTLAVIAIAMPIGYTLSFDSYPVRVGWANLLLAAELLIVARATLFPSTMLGGRWRWVAFGCLMTMALMTATRGVLGAWFTELYPSFTTPKPVNIVALLAANITLVLANVSVLVAWREEAEQELRLQASTDQLTGLLNRRGWNERANALLAQARRHHLPLSLIVLDLDFFKQINDVHGHEAGDKALCAFADVLTRCERRSDLIARLGGEEFGMLLPITTSAEAQHLVQRLREETAASAKLHLKHELDFSCGLAVLDQQTETLDKLMARADAALYRAKQDGRGRLVHADSLPDPQTAAIPA